MCWCKVAPNMLLPLVLPAGALPQRRVPVTYAGKATTPPPAASRSKRALIGSSSTTNATSDAETIEHLQEEVSLWLRPLLQLQLPHVPCFISTACSAGLQLDRVHEPGTAAAALTCQAASQRSSSVCLQPCQHTASAFSSWAAHTSLLDAHGPQLDTSPGVSCVALCRNAVLCCAVQVNTWRTATETCTKEKDFYYSKLRAIELLCNTPGVSGHPVRGNGR